jgi:hypothetical protein
MITCKVIENRMGHLTVTFPNGKSLYLQTDYDRAAFGVNCGAIKAPEDWDGQPSDLSENWWEIDWDGITSCPKGYEEQAEHDKPIK